jgi:hypothetical protein
MTALKSSLAATASALALIAATGCGGSDADGAA